ncbi:MAG TPA: GNAT family N-acetyltransferase [Sunxiuqinia sp.]|nr:GNAT family N-acetyltransferase [Sunxiuqinia sp.]
MIVREATPTDAGAIAEFQLQMALETENLQLDKPTVDLGVQAVFNDQSKGTYYVAEKNDQVIASLLTTFEWSDWRNGTVLWIQSVFVLPEFRGNGVYKKMYQHIQHCVEQDDRLKGIRLYVDQTNVRAQKVYSKLNMSAEHYQLFEWLKD